jgi:dipeptidyl-peptidase-4
LFLGACAGRSTELVASPAAQATHDGRKLVTFDAVYGEGAAKVDFAAKPASGFVWLDAERYLWPRTDPVTKERAWLAVDAASGATKSLLDLDEAAAALAKIPSMEKGKSLATLLEDPERMNAQRTAVLLDVGKDLWHYAFGADAAVRLTSTPEPEEVFGYSPDGKRVSFVRGNDLYVVDIEPLAERRLTTDGGEKILNGKLDWLYQEEVYGRGKFVAHWWSPDSQSLAFLRLDEHGVPVYTLVDDVKEPIEVETSPYPRAGEKNPLVGLGVARADGSGTTWVDLAGWAESEPLVVDVAWSPRNVLHFSVQDREQTWLELCSVSPAGAPVKLVRETTPAWVENNGSPRWLADGSFLWFSERDGWKHLYHHGADGKLVRQVTQGAFEVQTLHGVDEKAGWIYWSGTERSHVGVDAYRTKLDGTGQQRLTEREGTHVALFSPDFTRFLDTWSDVGTPPQVRLHGADGKELRVVDANPAPQVAEHVFLRPELLEVPTRDGFMMPALLIKPLGFEKGRTYPVFQHTYAGPHAPQVANKWLREMPFFQLLAQRGVAVWVCDNRTASGQGARSAWPCYLKLGESELADIEDGLAWLKKQGWVDAERIGISGWSYGGFMASYALTHSKTFAMGIAGGPVTEWDEYDSIYTERVMRLPKNNPEGYARTSVQAAAKDLHGALLLAHGAIDDNVHPGNTLRLAYALQKANKPFELQIYPRARHSLTSPDQNRHWRATMLRFVDRHLLGRAE